VRNNALLTVRTVLVILSVAENLVSNGNKHEILRYAQNDEHTDEHTAGGCASTAYGRLYISSISDFQ
jgi:hypothetical protein